MKPRAHICETCPHRGAKPEARLGISCKGDIADGTTFTKHTNKTVKTKPKDVESRVLYHNCSRSICPSGEMRIMRVLRDLNADKPPKTDRKGFYEFVNGGKLRKMNDKGELYVRLGDGWTYIGRVNPSKTVIERYKTD